MALSILYTADSMWREAIRDIGRPLITPLKFEKFNLINRACQITQGLIADVISDTYITETTPVVSTTGRYGTTGTFVSTTGVLTATMDSNFVAGDIGKLVILRKSSFVYTGVISYVYSATSVKLTGNYLPSSSQLSFDTITMISTSYTDPTISLSGINILRYGSQVKLQLLSSSTQQVVAMSREEFSRWINTSPSNSNTIVWCMVGSSIYLNKGTGLSTYGTLTLRYVRIPYTVSASTDYVDLLDGSMMQIAISLLRGMIQKRISIPVDIDKDLIVKQIQSIYNSESREVKKEEIQSKVESLI